jgi:antitoxin component YwqK of YwqJK toxin-antitoxin module
MTIALLITVLIGQQSLVDNSLDTLYLNRDYQITDKSDYDFVRVVKSINKEKTFNVTDFFKNGNIFFEGIVEFLNSDSPIGHHKFYYPNGQLQIEGEMFDNKNKEKIWYSSGQFMCELKSENDDLQFLRAFDPAGKSILINGYGFAQHEIFFSGQVWKGKVTNHKRDSLWACNNINTGQLQFEEYYRRGKLLGGKAYINGDIIEYKEIFSGSEIEKINSLQKKLKKFISAKEKKVRNSKPLFELLIKDGRIVQVKQMIRKVDETSIDIREFEIPSNFILLERGVPVKLVKISVRV